MCILYSTYVVFSIFIVLLTNNPGKITAALCVLRSARGLAVGVYCPLSILPSSMFFPHPTLPQPTIQQKTTKNNDQIRTKKEVWLKKLPRSNVDVVINVLASPKTAEMLPITGMKSATQNKGITWKKSRNMSRYMERYSSYTSRN